MKTLEGGEILLEHSYFAGMKFLYIFAVCWRVRYCAICRHLNFSIFYLFMRFFRISSFVALAALVAPSLTARENSMGVRAGFNTRNSSPVAGLWFQHEFAPHFRLAPNVDYIFRRNNTDALSINCNAQFPFRFGQSGLFAVYPLGGLNYTSWNYHHDDDPDTSDSTYDGKGDVTSRKNRFGINAGAGIEYRATPTLKLALEAKGTFVKSYSSATVAVSIGYIF